MNIPLTRAIAPLALLILLFGASLAKSEEISAGDSVEISVLEWDREVGQVRSWETINNEYQVSSDGMLYFPFIGAIVAAGLSSNELSNSLANQLLERLSLPDVPAVQVRMATSGPISVYGFVRNAGRIEHRPGQTVREIYVAAGGSPISFNEIPAFELKELSSRLELLETRRDILKNRLARLRAEGEGLDKLELPADVSAAAAEDQNREKLIFQINKEKSERRRQLLQGRIELLSGEITSLEQQIINNSRQLDLSKDELANIEALADRGLAVNARQLDALSLVSTFESRQLNLQLAITEARQNLSAAELDLIDIQSGASAEFLESSQNVQTQLLQLEDQHASLVARAKLLTLSLEPSAVLEAKIWRKGLDAPLLANFDEPVFAGDTIEIRSASAE